MALAENSGLEPIRVLTEIKAKQISENNHALGVDCMGLGNNGKLRQDGEIHSCKLALEISFRVSF